MSLLGSIRTALAAGLSLSVIGCASSGPTVEQVNAANAGRETKCEQQGYRRGTKDFYTCLQLAANQEATNSVQSAVTTQAGIGGALVGLSLLSAFSDERVKRDIIPVGSQNGFTLYRFRYLWSDQTYVGVMAQEVRAAIPEAVITGDDGYLRVNYDLLGLRMVTLSEWETRGPSSVRKRAAAGYAARF